MTTPSRPPRAWLALLALMPRRFRDRYGADMTATFLARRADASARGRLALAGFWRRAAWDAVRLAIAERRQSSLDVPLPPGAPRPGGGRPMFGLSQDVRYALRQMRRQPWHAAFVVLTLAVGIGANAAVFSVVDAVLLRPLPYPSSDRLVGVWGRFVPESGFDFPQFPLSLPEYLDYRDHNRTMAGVAAYANGSGTITGGGQDAERVPMASVTTNLFAVLGVPVAIGRDFAVGDAEPNAPAVVILSHDFWRRRFAADPGVLGRRLDINGVPRTVIGVASPAVAFPSRETAVWRPLTIDPANPGGRSSHFLQAFARLADGRPLAEAESELAVMMQQWKAQYPDVHTGHFLFVRPMLDDVVGDSRLVLQALLGATGFLLLIVCANVSNLVLIRGETRLREMAVRSALGAERRRLLRLAAVESGLLAALGAIGGVALAWTGVRALTLLEETGVPRVAEVAVNGRVLLFTMLASAAAAVLFGLLPAWRGAAPSPGLALRSDDRTASAGAGRLRFRRLLVAAEVAITVVLVLGAGLMIRSLSRLVAVDPGFDPRQVYLVNLSLPASAYPDGARVNAFYDELLGRLAGIPAVASVSGGTGAPIFSGNGVWDFELEGRPEPAQGAPAWNAAITFTWPGYFDALRIPILRGRPIGQEDTLTSEPVVVINQSLADRFFAGEDPIGRRLRIAGDNNRPWARIVGIAGDVRDRSLELGERPMYYMAYRQSERTAGFQGGFLVLVARTTGEPTAAAAAIRETVRAIDRDLPLYSGRTYDEVLSRSFAQRSFATTLFGVFAMVGVLLGATGIYGVLTYSVALRSGEIGIRRALGASPLSVVRLVVQQGMAPVGFGLVAGLIAAVGASRWLESQLYGITRFDPLTYAIVVAAVLATAAAACLLPARRALRVNPVTAMRAPS